MAQFNGFKGSTLVSCPGCSEGLVVDYVAERVLLVDPNTDTAEAATLRIDMTDESRARIGEHPCFVVTDEDRAQLAAYVAELNDLVGEFNVLADELEDEDGDRG